MIVRLFNLTAGIVMFPIAFLLFMNRCMIGFMLHYVKGLSKLVRNPA